MKHNLFEDFFALVVGAVLISLGVTIFNQIGLLTGGTAGFAFLIHYSTKIQFGVLFFLINTPFYILAIKKMGWFFTLKTFFAISLVSLMTYVHPHYIHIDQSALFYATPVGALLMGVGFIVLFRHKASLGGVNILSLYLQEHHGILAGKTLMFVDIIIVLLSFFIVDISLIFSSIIGSVIMNLCIMFNHRPGRYVAV